jgi:AMP-polyphosphate phosphotransferase
MARAPRLQDIDLSIRVPADEAYHRKLQALQLELLMAQNRLRDAPASGGPRPSLCVVFEGMDAAGKGGAIRRLTGRLDPRGYRVHPIGPPSQEEHAHHWLWRFSSRMPARGEIAIFDRSWYGRVLVERVEGFAKPKEWKRAYDEIADFERSHVKAGVVLVKFWLQISRKEQLRRFHEREKDPFKEYKIGPEDWRNRRHWERHARAAEDMFEATHGKHAPWTLVSAEDKQNARLQVLKTTVLALRKTLSLEKA